MPSSKQSTKSKSKSLVIIVPGYQLYRLRISKFVVNTICNLFNIDNNDQWMIDLKNYLTSNSNFDVEIFNYKPGFTKKYSFKPIAQRLAKLIESKKNHSEILIFSKCFGGVITNLAVNNLSKKNNLKRIILVAAPHKSDTPFYPKKLEVINIYSKNDQLIKKANKILRLSKVYQLRGHLNLELNMLSHYGFNHNSLIKVNKHKIKLFDLYLKLLTSKSPGKLINDYQQNNYKSKQKKK